MAASLNCLANSDNQFGPRVDTDCRGFDFTLLFEDAFFIVLPAAFFLLLLPARLQILCRASRKVTTYRLAVYKFILLSALFALHVAYAVYHLRAPVLHTKLAITSDVFEIIATAAAMLLSFMEDQRSIEPSDTLVVYFSALTILDIPRLRSLWLIPSTDACRGLWTTIYILTVLALLLESTRKLNMLRALYRHVTMEQVIGFWGRSFFLWVTPFFRVGYSNVLSVEDIPEVDEDLQGDVARGKLEKAWARSKQDRRLLKAVFRAYLWPTFSAVVPRLALSAFKFCQPFLITSTVDYFEEGSEAEIKEYGQALVGAYLLVYLGMAISTAIYWRQTYRLGTMARAGLISMIYQQTTQLTGNDVKDTAALTLMGTDVERIVDSLKSLHETWASIIEVAVALYLLERQVSLACLVPAVISLACVSGAGQVSARTAPAQKAWVEKVQTRLAVTSAMLGDMKAVKMLGLTDVLFNLITKLREAELNTSCRFRKLLVWTVVLSNIPSAFAPYATFAVYAIISVVRNDQSLLASQAFTSLSLVSLLTSPLLEFVQAVPSVIESMGCFERIEVYLEKKPAEAYVQFPSTSASSDALTAAQRETVELTAHTAKQETGPTVMSFKGVDITWSSDTKTVFENLTLEIGKGITMIIGPVGSGKSALIESILGETVIRNGITTAPLSNVAYCPQTPWIVNNTIQHNITGGTEFDAKWYAFCVSACGLEDDLRTLPAGSMHMTGSDGVSLSGGQKQRVALARAVYSRLPILLLDDVFSGLDSKCISHISSRLFAPDGYLREAGKSVILATHTQRLLPYADEIIVLNERAVVDRGSYKDILARAPDIAAKFLTLPEDEHEVAAEEKVHLEEICSPATKASRVQNDKAKELPDLSRRDGTWDVYKYYAQSAGLWITFCFIASFFISTFFSNFSTLWIQWWSDSNAKEPNAKVGLYLGVYTAFTVLNVCCFILGCYLLFINIINDTGLGLHTDLLTVTLKAPFSFFQMTDSGSITNRFSQDIDLIDMTLPAWVVNTVANGSLTVINLVTLCAVGKYIAAFFPAVVVAFVLIQSYYLRTSRQVRLLDIEAKSPLYTQFSETMKGIATIRAFGWQETFQAECQKRLNRSQKPFYMLLCIQQWLSLVLDLVVTAMAIILLAITTSLKDTFSAGVMGVALNLILTFNRALVRTIQSWTQLETSIGAVSRVQNFQKETPSEERGLGTQPPPVHEWPSEGAVSLEDITAVYNSETAPVLKNLSLNIGAGDKIAVCGPSGSGKSSLIMALLQMIEIQRGRVLIDGRDLTSLEPGDIRLRLNVIPQDPFFMPGTVRLNLNPRERVPDDVIETAIKKVGLWNRVSGNGGLDMDLKASDWSVGERQLLALARALTVQSPILILDEATSSVDWKTESMMHKVIEEGFTNQTVIAVVHRFRYIDHFDRVALLRNGELIECDTPTALLGRDSEFKKLYTSLQKGIDYSVSS